MAQWRKPPWKRHGRADHHHLQDEDNGRPFLRRSRPPKMDTGGADDLSMFGIDDWNPNTDPPGKPPPWVRPPEEDPHG